MKQELMNMVQQAVNSIPDHVDFEIPNAFAEAFAKLVAAALAQQEPWCMKMNGCKTKCEDCPDEPAQRPWVGLTHQDISNEVISDEPDFVQGFVQGARWADALLEEKNNG